MPGVLLSTQSRLRRLIRSRFECGFPAFVACFLLFTAAPCKSAKPQSDVMFSMAYDPEYGDLGCY